MTPHAHPWPHINYIIGRGTLCLDGHLLGRFLSRAVNTKHQFKNDAKEDFVLSASSSRKERLSRTGSYYTVLMGSYRVWDWPKKCFRITILGSRLSFSDCLSRRKTDRGNLWITLLSPAEPFRPGFSNPGR